jgi:hypothetical protein
MLGVLLSADVAREQKGERNARPTRILTVSVRICFVLVLFRNIFQLPTPLCPLSSNESIERLSTIIQSTQRVVLVKSARYHGLEAYP